MVLDEFGAKAKKMSTRFEEILTEALELSPLERITLIERLAASFAATVRDQSQPLSEPELAELMRVEPLSPEEIAAQGLLGTWADQGVEDGAEWVNERKRQRQERRKW